MSNWKRTQLRSLLRRLAAQGGAGKNQSVGHGYVVYEPVKVTNNLATSERREERRGELARRAEALAEYLTELGDVATPAAKERHPSRQSRPRAKRGRLGRLRPTRSIRRPKR